MRTLFFSFLAATLLAGVPFLDAQAAGHAKEIASGSLTGDNNHVVTGNVIIRKHGDKFEVVLDEAFTLDGAPDPKLGFGKNGQYDTSTTFHKLKKLSGEQIYVLPAGIDPKKYNEFYVWCEKFDVSLGHAKLK